MRPRGTISVVIAITAAVQIYTWHDRFFVDQNFWVKKAENFHQDIQKGPLWYGSLRYPVHPAAPLLLASSAGQALGMPPLGSIRAAIILLNTACISCSILLLRNRFPQIAWWISGGGVLLLSTLHRIISPADAVFAPLVFLAWLLLLWHIQAKGRSNLQVSIALGVAVGLTLSTRIHLAIIFFTPALLVSSVIIGWRRLLVIGSTAVAVMVISNPLLWHAPWIYLQSALIGEYRHATQSEFTIPLPQVQWPEAVQYSLLASISFLVGLLYLWRHHWPMPLPRPFLKILLGTTIISVLMVKRSNVETIRYFYPLILTWEALLPLFCLHAARLSSEAIRLSPAQSRLVAHFVTAILIVTFWLA